MTRKGMSGEGRNWVKWWLTDIQVAEGESKDAIVVLTPLGVRNSCY